MSYWEGRQTEHYRITSLVSHSIVIFSSVFTKPSFPEGGCIGGRGKGKKGGREEAT